MPLLHGKPFVKKKSPSGANKDLVVFHNECTDEVFTEYSEFCERVIQCNSLVWVCAITGRSGLTYEEAKDSEEYAQSILDSLPVEIQVPALYVASQTHQTDLKSMVDDVFNYMKDRYFVGEHVEFSADKSIWCDCRVLKVLEKRNDALDSPGRRDPESGEPSISMYQYKLDYHHSSSSGDVSEVIYAESCQLKRKNDVLSREKLMNFLSLYTEVHPGKLCIVQDSILQGYGIPNVVHFGHIFCGSPPSFLLQTDKKDDSTISKKEKKQSNIEKYLITSPKSSEPIPKTPPKKRILQNKKAVFSNSIKKAGIAKKVSKKYKSVVNKLKARKSLLHSMRERELQNKREFFVKRYGTVKSMLQDCGEGNEHSLYQKRKDVESRKKEKAEMALREKRTLLEQKRQEKARLKEEKLRLAKFVKEWQQHREDLECEDLKDLPVPRQVQCSVPNEHFGDFIMILEFLHSFSDTLSTKDYFPSGVTFELLERALMVEEVAGPLYDILQLLLTSLFKMQGEEDDEVLEGDNSVLDVEKQSDGTLDNAIALATAAKNYAQQYHGVPLKELYMDCLSLSEIIRLHFLSSGGRAGERRAKWRYQQRGGYMLHDDPGLLLCVEEPQLMNTLGSKSVGELPLGDKLKILTCLINQILTYATLRDIIGEKVRQVKAELRSFQIAQLKQKREAAAARLKGKKAAKLKSEDMLSAIVGNDQEPKEISEAQKVKEEKELLRKKQDAERKATELFRSSMCYQVLPLGTDRAYRRFWMFSSVPGLFVERDCQWTGPCLSKPTPYNPSLTSTGDIHQYIQRLFEEEKNTGSDKENDDCDADVTRPIHSPGKKMLLEKNMCDTVVSDRSNVSSSTLWSNEMEVDEDKVGQDLLCTASEKCPVHSSPGKPPSWGFFHKEEDVVLLIECLNPRGVREGDLRRVLIQEKDTILENIRRCPVQKLDQTCVHISTIPEVRKSARNNPVYKDEDTNFGYPPGTPLSEILELTVRGHIVDTEEQLYNGGLGSLKVYNREMWREVLGNRGYDKQCDSLTWGGAAYSAKQKALPHVRMNKGDGGITADVPDDMLVNEKSDDTSAVDDSDDKTLDNYTVRNLACAILQVAQSVPRKYLKKPLGYVSSGNKQSPSQMELWEMSLMECTSYSQLYLHLTTLNNSIQWSRSATKAYCRICKRGRDPDKMLLCDDCNKGHHMYCLKPKLTCVPQGDWYCPSCRPAKTVRTSRKSRHLFEEESDSDGSDQEEMLEKTCNNCGLSGNLLSCSLCCLAYHIECIQPPLRNKPRGSWQCNKCKPSKYTKSKGGGSLCNSDEETGGNNHTSVEDDTTCSDTPIKEKVVVVSSRRSARFSQEINTDLPLNNAALQDLLTELINHEDGWPFLRPVSKSLVPDYHHFVKRPMDFGTMRSKLNTAEYKANEEFIADALLVFENCEMYNYSHTEEYAAGARLNCYFQKRCLELGLVPKEEDLHNLQAKKLKLTH